MHVKTQGAGSDSDSRTFRESTPNFRAVTQPFGHVNCLFEQSNIPIAVSVDGRRDNALCGHNPCSLWLHGDINRRDSRAYGV
jgi:hypothetical protein